MGCGAVHDGHARLGEEKGVQRVRIAGADNVFRLQSGLLRPGADLAHKGGFAAAGSALQNVDGPGLLGGEQVVVQGVKAGGGIGPQKVLNMWQSSHKRPSVSMILRLSL